MLNKINNLSHCVTQLNYITLSYYKYIYRCCLWICEKFKCNKITKQYTKIFKAKCFCFYLFNHVQKNTIIIIIIYYETYILNISKEQKIRIFIQLL